MADIKIHDINIKFDGSDFFANANDEGFMKDLSDDELTANYGGMTCNSSYACSGRPIRTCKPN